MRFLSKFFYVAYSIALLSSAWAATDNTSLDEGIGTNNRQPVYPRFSVTPRLGDSNLVYVTWYKRRGYLKVKGVERHELGGDAFDQIFSEHLNFLKRDGFLGNFDQERRLCDDAIHAFLTQNPQPR